MCEQCIAIDKVIKRFRQVQRTIIDPLTIDRAKEAIADLEAKKAALRSNDPDQS